MKLSLIFDLDGTLVDSLPGIAASLNRTLASHGMSEHSAAAIRSFVGDGLPTLVRRAAPAAADPALLASLVALFKKDYALSWADGTRVYPGVVGMLEELQQSGFQLAVLSNKTHEFTATMTRAMFGGIEFAAVLGQQQGMPHKPDPRCALQIAATFGSPATACVIIGDSSMDIETAANAGMRSIAVTWGYHDRARLLAAGATCLLDHPAELPGLLATWAAE